jgi:hypothetical protein
MGASSLPVRHACLSVRAKSDMEAGLPRVVRVSGEFGNMTYDDELGPQLMGGDLP